MFILFEQEDVIIHEEKTKYFKVTKKVGDLY